MSPEESPRRKLARVRPPRVQITYDVETGSGVHKVELPFVVGVLADLAGHPDPDADPPGRNSPRRRFVTIDRNNFDQMMNEIRPRLGLRVPDQLRKDGSRIPLELHFRSIEDFEPVNVVRQVEPLRKLLESRQRLAKLRIELEHNDQVDDLLQRIIHDQEQLRRLARDTGRPTDESPASKASTPNPAESDYLDLIGQLVEGVINGKIPVSDDTGRMLAGQIAELDRLLSDQLNAVMHDPEFQKLEASWRGLHYLVFETEMDQVLRIRVLNVSKRELLRDMTRAPEFDQGVLFRKVYVEELDVLGGQPYGVLIGDYEFGEDPQDIGLLKWIAQVAAAAHAPFIAAAALRLFGWESYDELAVPRDLVRIFGGRGYDEWNAFRKSEESRYVALCLPHVLMRGTYGHATRPVEEFRFEEDVDGPDHRKYLWGNAAYVLGARITNAFASYGWCAAIRGVEGGGMVKDLPLHSFTNDDGEIDFKRSTEVFICDRREHELANLGFIPLYARRGTDDAVFFSVPSCHKPLQYMEDFATASAYCAAQLPYILTASRFAHFIKVMARGEFGWARSAKDCEEWLNGWISNYVTPTATATDETRRNYPLGEAVITVENDPRRLGCALVIARLRPHYMLEDDLSVPMRLVVELAGPVK